MICRYFCHIDAHRPRHEMFTTMPLLCLTCFVLIASWHGDSVLMIATLRLAPVCFFLTGTAEREARFQTMKQEAAAANGGGTGSFFAFHGSGPGNWHGILHMGLKNMSGEWGTRCAPGVS